MSECGKSHFQALEKNFSRSMLPGPPRWFIALPLIAPSFPEYSTLAKPLVVAGLKLTIKKMAAC